MPTPLRAFLMLRTHAGSWDVHVCQTIEDLTAVWARRPETVCGAVLHIGFERRPARCYETAVAAHEGRLLLTCAAKASLPPAFESSTRAVASSDEDEPLYLGIQGWGYTAIESEPEPEPEPESTLSAPGAAATFEDWVREFVVVYSGAGEQLAEAGVTCERSYLEQEDQLPADLRRDLGLFRSERLLAGKWDDPFAIARVAPPWLRGVPVEQLHLTARIGNVFQAVGIRTVDDIGTFSLADMLRRANFGRTSARQLAESLKSALQSGPEQVRGSAPRDVAPTLLLAVRQSLLALDPRSRDIVARRMGLDGPCETLEQISQSYDVTRERIRQLEARAIAQIVGDEYWDDLLAKKVHALLAGREFPLPLVGVEAVDAWFSGFGTRVDAARYILSNLCATSVGIVTISGIDYLSEMDQARWDATVASARNMLKHAVGQDWARDFAERMVGGLLPANASEFASLLWSEVSARCQFGGDDEDAVLLRYGSGADQIVETVLFDAPEPLHYSQIAQIASARAKREIDERRAHSAAAEVGYLFGRGTYGLLKHVPIPLEELTGLGEEAADIVLGGEPSRQWHASELLDELIARGVVRDGRVDKYIVDIALCEQDFLKSLGRMVWSAPGTAADASRIDIRQALIAILQQAGEPLSSGELRQRLIAVRGINSTMQFHVADPLIKLDSSTWGLNDRDLQVKRADQPALLDRVVGTLSDAGRPIHISEAKDFLDCEVPPRALFCLAANDARLHVSLDRRLHLRAWLA